MDQNIKTVLINYLKQKTREEYNALAVLTFYNGLSGLPESVKSCAVEGYCVNLYLHDIPDELYDGVAATEEFDNIAAQLSGKDYQEGLGAKIISGGFDPVEHTFTNFTEAFAKLNELRASPLTTPTQEGVTE